MSKTTRLTRLPRRLFQEESGVVVLIFAALLTVFLSFAALAIDLTYAASSMQQARSSAQLAALAALERYFFLQSQNATHADRLTAALDRANSVSGLNFVLGGEHGPETLVTSGAGPQLIPGQFFFANRADGSSPCLQSEQVPCFVPTTGSEPVNAFQVAGNYYQDVTLRVATMAFGNTQIAIPVDVTATIVPRHGCFVVDLSRSMIRETHSNDDNPKEQYAYYLEADNSGTPPPVEDPDFNALQAIRPGGTPVKTDHYKSDYVTRGILDDAEYVAATHDTHHPDPIESSGLYSFPTNRNYRIDLFRQGDEYPGPEPLNTVFRGIDRAMEYLETRAVAGDMACLVFYDDNLSWPRIFSLTSDFSYLRKATNLAITNDANQGLEFAVAHGLFPFISAGTNTMLGLSEAVRQLASTSSQGVPSSDFIVLIGDGLTNCNPCNFNRDYDRNDDGRFNDSDTDDFWACIAPNWVCPGIGSSMCPGTYEQCEWADSDNDGVVQDDMDDYYAMEAERDKSASCPNGAQCSNTYKNHYYSMLAVKEFVEESIVPALIPIHVMMVGSDVGPHTVDIADPDAPTQCLTESQKRSLRAAPGQSSNYDTVRGHKYGYGSEPYCESSWTSSTTASTSCHPADPGNNISNDFRDASAADPFYQVNADMYAIATMTGGIWAPLRPLPQGTCTPLECDPTQIRRTTDPLCRTPAEQMDAYIDEIMGQNPFTLVVPRKQYSTP